MTPSGIFPFGQPVREVVQADRTQKRVFVLGVYASAVHARWIGGDNKTLVSALVVASEPYIFWRGENAESIIRQITIPPQLGKLVPANQQYNGPSGVALDELILKPLGVTRTEAWLCDLVLHSCLNTAQATAIKRAYLPIANEYGLPKPTVLPVPKARTDENRRTAILDEFRESGAHILILLGDKPIQWFLAHFDPRWKKLTDFTCNGDFYGKLHVAQINGKPIEILPLAHPRQIAKLGRSSSVWHSHHQVWASKHAGKILSSSGSN
jgi:hypothetical protein